MRVLVVEDDAITRQLILLALHENGHEAVTAENGAEALERVQREGLRLVVTDWQMPTMDGIELCRRLRSLADTPYVYVIMLSGATIRNPAVQAMQAGADDFLTKPFDPAELLLRVRAGGRVIERETRDLVVMGLARLAESRDLDTGRHLERCQVYTRILAEYLLEQGRDGAVNRTFVELIYETSPLHDIGKVAVPDAVLRKPGKLTATEFEQIKLHPRIGERTLDDMLIQRPSAGFLRMARDIAGYHHERWDGAGYPRGLSGDAIPLSARIMAVADVYDALTTKRVYKPAFSHAKAIEIVAAESGAQFDPALVRAFLAREREFDTARRRLADAGESSAIAEEALAESSPRPVVATG